MKDLLAGVECRYVLHYAAGQVFETVMRHVLPAVAVVLRAGRVIEAATATPLMATPRLALLAAPGRHPAGARAVPLAAITAAADEEDLPALGAVAHDEAQRIHGSAPRPPRTGRRPRAVRRRISSTPALGVRPEGPRVESRAFALFGYGAGVLSRSADRRQFSAIASRFRIARILESTDTGYAVHLIIRYGDMQTSARCA
jgi:hypothetical protein